MSCRYVRRLVTPHAALLFAVKTRGSGLLSSQPSPASFRPILCMFRLSSQHKFNQKFKRCDEAQAFFDANHDGEIDEAGFYDVLRYAGCWNGPSLGRATFKALVGEQNDVLGVREFVERLLVPDHRTERELTDRLGMTSTKPAPPKELTEQQYDIVTRFKAQLAQQKRHMNFSLRPLFRKMKSDGSGALFPAGVPAHGCSWNEMVVIVCVVRQDF